MPSRLVVAVVIVLGTMPLWLWALDSVFHFGYAP